MNRSLLFTISLLAILLSDAGNATAEKISLSEPKNDSRSFLVEYVLKMTGSLQLEDERQRPIQLSFKANASLEYEERSVPQLNENVSARSLRYYRKAQAESTIDKDKHKNQLNERKFLVAEVHRGKIRLYDLRKPLTIQNLELLRIPADSVGIHRLLPVKSVKTGDSWILTSNAAVLLTGLENITDLKISCRLESMDQTTARISFTGRARGILDGASAEIDLSGYFSFDIENRFIRKLQMKFTQKTKDGPVAPPSQSETLLVMNRVTLENSSALSDDVLRAIPKKVSPDLLALRFEYPSVISFDCDRNWKIFHVSKDYAILRLIEDGQFLAQCKVAPLQKQAQERHLSEKQFQKDIAVALGAKFKSIDKAEELETKDGRFLYRVTVSGQLGKQPMRWLYYLCADPRGSQVALVFSMDRSAEKQFGNRDFSIVKSLRFLSNPRSASNIRK